MSGNSYKSTKDDYRDYAPSRSWSSPPPPDPAVARRLREEEEAERARRDAERAERLRVEREKLNSAPPPGASKREKRDTSDLYDRSLVRGRITRPDSLAQSATIVLTDNSGSNARVAKRVRDSSGYMLGTMGVAIGDRTQLAMIYGSDHCDGIKYRQDVDFLYPNENGDRVMYSTTSHVREADGDDAAEAFECLLWEACDIDFGHLKQEDRHLILVTDVVGHGMGIGRLGLSDYGCSRHDWKKSVERVYATYGTFQVVGTGSNEAMGDLQRQFLHEDRRFLDLIDLSAIETLEHRLGIVPNAVLFLMARNLGPQATINFLKLLYEKWLRDPVFGHNTDLQAQEAIARFFKYIEGNNEELRRTWAKEIFAL